MDFGKTCISGLLGATSGFSLVKPLGGDLSQAEDIAIPLRREGRWPILLTGKSKKFNLYSRRSSELIFFGFGRETRKLNPKKLRLVLEAFLVFRPWEPR